MSKPGPDEKTAELRDLTRELKSSGHNGGAIHASLYSSRRWYRRTVASVEIHPLDERIRQLCAKAATADDSEAEEVLAELQSALREHNEFVRAMISHTLNRVA